uniref:ATP synthase complex subunit 8 n=1 Tax=Chelipoda sp. YD3012 TaxID=2775393 RepID=A0A7L8EXZ1_9MUSC|nr:ATP synthase F0 subunit 8 [Chelipoda sp. YD3012]
MPQMAPISWLSLFIMFTMAFILFCMMNYYSTLPNSPKTLKVMKSLTNNIFNWKW